MERTHDWFAGIGKLRIRLKRRLDIHLALLKLAAAIICARFVDKGVSRSNYAEDLALANATLDTLLLRLVVLLYCLRLRASS